LTILTASHLAKRYVTYANNFQRFASWFGAPVTPVEEFWPAKDISFSLRAGEAIAIIGQNGAGKSTLLKLITGTVRPTQGAVHVGGRVGAILELGLGFNPDFTGRENVYHAGGLMGLSRARLDELMPDIEDFAEIGEFFNQPFRVYSSGMQARLAFALVSAERPAILIVDEVLSVGDSYFQHKSFDRIRSFKEKGTSLILVTHALGDVRSLCDRVILLDKGQVLKDGLPDEVVDFYNAMIAAKESAKLTVEQRRSKEGWLYTRSGTLEVQVKALELLDTKTRDPVVAAMVSQDLTLRVTACAEVYLKRLVLGLMLRDRAGHVVWGSNTWHTKQVIEDVKAGETIIFEVAFECLLGPGSYSISPALTNAATHLDANYEWSDNAFVFDVVNIDRAFFMGTAALDARFHIERRLPSAQVIG
jgi:lipopolysaccharide transport system ATP-binding protein